MICAVLFVVTLVSCTSLLVFSYGYDRSFEYATLKTDVYADELLTEKIGASLHNAERQYLRTQSGFLLSYNSHIPTTAVSAEFDEDTGTLTVTASEYTYTAVNGITVVWKPKSVTLISDEQILSAPEYTASYINVSPEAAESVNVEFETEFVIPAAAVNELLNLAYTNAPLHEKEIRLKSEEYERLKAEHILASEKHEAYLLLLKAYNEYLSEKRIYDEKYKEYSGYISELEKYNKAKAEYDAYITARDKYYIDYALYLDYLAYASVNQSKIDAYEKYTEKLERAQAQLNIIHSIKIEATTLKRSVYNAIVGDTVTSVIANKDAIANNLTGADPKAVDLAGAATENLRALFKDFFAIMDENEQYNYYVTNYEAFRDNFANLFRALDKLYMNSKVRGVLISQDKQEKYIILLAELYYVTTALSDAPVKNYDGTAYFDKNYIVGKGYPDAESPLSIMEGTPYIADTNDASPIDGGYPAPAPKPEFTKMDEPVMPKPVSLPIAPHPIEEPTAPVQVQEPEYVPKPGNAPEEYIPEPDVIAVIEAYNKGELEARSYNGSDIIYTPRITVTKKFCNIDEVTVIFYDREYTDREEARPLYEITVDYGTYADYAASVPKKKEDSKHTYVHLGWCDSRGESIDLSAVTADTSLYPTFTAVEKEYTTTWVVDGAEYDYEPEAPEKPPVGNYCYTFEGWHEDTDSVTSDITLSAIFKEHCLLEVTHGGAEITYSETTVTASVGSYYGEYSIDRLLENFAGKYSLTLNTAKGTLAFSYTDTLAMKSAGVSKLDLSVLRRLDGEYSCTFRLLAEDGAEIPLSVKATAFLPYTSDDPESVEVFYGEETEKLYVKASYDGISLSFTAYSGRTYFTSLDYSVTVLPIDSLTISADRTVLKSGERVNVSVSAPGGIKIDRLYYLDSQGVKHGIEGGSFVMPPENITLGADYTVEEYTVIFVSDGKTIASFTCRYGDTVLPPKDPQKASTDNFSYTFIGWSEDIIPVTGDAVYTAVYARRVIDGEKVDTGLQITPSVMRIILLAVSACVLLFVIILPSLVMTLIVFKRRKSKLKVNSR